MDLDPAELALVYKALTSGLSNCVEWKNEEVMRRIRADASLQGLTPAAIRGELLAFVGTGGTVRQIVEKREEYHILYRFFYKTNMRIPGFPTGLFVEMVLSDDDPDVPVVSLVNAHF